MEKINQITTCSANHVLPKKPGWNVSYLTGTDIDGAILSVFRIHNNLPNEYGGMGRIQYGSGDKKQFKTSAEAQQWAFEHGYLSRHYSKRL